MDNEPKITIESKKDNSANPVINFFDPKADIAAKFDFYIKIVIGVLVVAVLTMLFMVSGLLLDALHFNSTVYREYSEKINTLDAIQKSNQLLIEQNKENQQLILSQQKQIIDLLQKK